MTKDIATLSPSQIPIQCLASVKRVESGEKQVYHHSSPKQEFSAVYFDDVVVASQTWAEHVAHFTLPAKKLMEYQVKTQLRKVEEIHDYPVPATYREVFVSVQFPSLCKNGNSPH